MCSKANSRLYCADYFLNVYLQIIIVSLIEQNWFSSSYLSASQIWWHSQALGWHSYTESISQLYKSDCFGKSPNFWVYVFFVAPAVSLTVNFCVEPVHFLKSAMGNCIICSSKKPMNCFVPVSLTWCHCKVASLKSARTVINFIPLSTNKLNSSFCLMVNPLWQWQTW